MENFYDRLKIAVLTATTTILILSLATANAFVGMVDDNQYHQAAVLSDSAYLDSDFDGVTVNDKCSDTPHQIVHFNPYDQAYYMGQVIKLVDIYEDGSMTFEISGKTYGVEVGKTTYIKPNTRNLKGFGIEGLFTHYSPHTNEGYKGSNYAIAVIKRTDINVTTGCLSK